MAREWQEGVTQVSKANHGLDKNPKQIALRIRQL